MKTILLAALFFASSYHLWAETEQAFQDSMAKQVEAVRKQLADPKTTPAQKASLADYELTLLDQYKEDLTNRFRNEMQLAQSLEDAAKDGQKKSEASTASDPAPSESWHEVITFSGGTAKNSPPFTVKSERWRVRWKFTTSQAAKDMIKNSPGYSADTYAGLTARVVSEDSPKADSQDIVTKIGGPASDTTELHGSGTWSLHVDSASSDWTLVVEEFR